MTSISVDSLVNLPASEPVSPSRPPKLDGRRFDDHLQRAGGEKPLGQPKSASDRSSASEPKSAARPNEPNRAAGEPQQTDAPPAASTEPNRHPTESNPKDAVEGNSEARAKGTEPAKSEEEATEEFVVENELLVPVVAEQPPIDPPLPKQLHSNEVALPTQPTSPVETLGPTPETEPVPQPVAEEATDGVVVSDKHSITLSRIQATTVKATPKKPATPSEPGPTEPLPEATDQAQHVAEETPEAPAEVASRVVLRKPVGEVSPEAARKESAPVQPTPDETNGEADAQERPQKNVQSSGRRPHKSVGEGAAPKRSARGHSAPVENKSEVTAATPSVAATSSNPAPAAAVTADPGPNPAASSQVAQQPTVSEAAARQGPPPTPASQPDTSIAAPATSGPRPARTETSAEFGGVDRVRFVQRVARAFQTAGERGGPLRLRLSPPELGSLRIEVSIHEGTLSARLEAETPAARTMLLENLPALRDRLAQHEIKVDRFDVELLGQSSSGLPDRSAANPDSDGTPGSAAWRNKRKSDSGTAAPAAVPSASRQSSGGDQLNIII